MSIPHHSSPDRDRPASCARGKKPGPSGQRCVTQRVTIERHQEDHPLLSRKELVRRVERVRAAHHYQAGSTPRRSVLRGASRRAGTGNAVVKILSGEGRVGLRSRRSSRAFRSRVVRQGRRDDS